MFLINNPPRAFYYNAFGLSKKPHPMKYDLWTRRTMITITVRFVTNRNAYELNKNNQVFLGYEFKKNLSFRHHSFKGKRPPIRAISI